MKNSIPGSYHVTCYQESNSHNRILHVHHKLYAAALQYSCSNNLPLQCIYVFHAISFGRDLVTVTKNDSISINLPLVNKVKMLQIDHFTPLYYVQGNKLPWMSISITKIRECSKGARCNSLVCKLKQFHLTSQETFEGQDRQIRKEK